MRSIGSAASLAAMIGQRAAHDRARPASWRRRRPRPGSRRRRCGVSSSTTCVERVDREMDGERRAGRGEGGERLALRHARGAAGDARQHHALRDLGHGQLAAERGGGGGEGRHARRQRIGDAAPLEPAQLLGERAADREVARMQARHVLSLPRAPPRTRPRSRRATAARYRRCARRSGNARAARAARSSRHRGRPGSGRSGRVRAP